MQWIALDPSALSDPALQRPDLPAVTIRPIDVPKDFPDVAVLAPDFDLPPTPDATLADAAQLSKTYGRYVGDRSMPASSEPGNAHALRSGSFLHLSGPHSPRQDGQREGSGAGAM